MQSKKILSRRNAFLAGILVFIALSLCACAAAPGGGRDIDTAAASDKALTAVNAETDELYDKYAAYYTASQYKVLFDDYNGTFGGIGVSMAANKDGEIVVYGIIANTPAADSKIAEGDVILKVGDTSLACKDTVEAAALIRGDVDTEVTLELRNSAGETYTQKLKRATITETTVRGSNLKDYPGTAYIQISGFSSLTASEFADKYNELYAETPIKNLILDLRSNGGGNFFASISVGEYFVPLNEIVVSEKTSSGTEDYRSKNGQLSQLKVVILQNAYTASASEVLIGAIRDKGNATLIGSTTYGKGVTQAIGQFDSGSGYRYTRSIYYTPGGFSLDGVGIEPDIVVEDPENPTYANYFSMDPNVNAHLKAALQCLFPNDNTEEEIGGGSEEASGDDKTSEDKTEETAE